MNTEGGSSLDEIELQNFNFEEILTVNNTGGLQKIYLIFKFNNLKTKIDRRMK